MNAKLITLPFAVGLFGGAIGEMILFFNILKNIGYENVISNKKLEKNIFNCLNLILKNGVIEFGINEKIIPELPKLDETLNFENILMIQIEKLDELKELLMMNISSSIVVKMIEKFGSLGLDEALTKEVVTIFFKFAFEQDNGKKHSIIYKISFFLKFQAKNIKFVKIAQPTNLKRKALCHIFPLLEELPFAEEILEKKDKECNLFKILINISYFVFE